MFCIYLSLNIYFDSKQQTQTWKKRHTLVLWSSGWHLLSCTGRKEQKKRKIKKKDIYPHKFFLRHTCDSVPLQSRDANFKNHIAQFQVQPVYQCVVIWVVLVYIFQCWEARHLLKWQSGCLHANWLLLWNPNLLAYQILQKSQ